ncbi:MAG: bacteriocin [Limnohabitans sp.]|nr:bacteriocin [Limnohabitans sp.]
MEIGKFKRNELTKNELKTINGGNEVIPVSTTTQITDFNSSRSNRERGR